MGDIRHFFIIVVAYNEEKTLAHCTESVFKSALFNKKRRFFSCDLVICQNGCTDNTPVIAEELKEKYSTKYFDVHVISSPKGMVIAQAASIDWIRKQNNGHTDPIIFVDADAFIDESVIYLLLDQFMKHPDLKAVGARAVPIPYSGPSVIKKLWDKVFNCRAYFPKSEIAVYFAPEFHPYADSDPQPGYAEFEKRSKIYFHGRCFALRDQSIWDVPRNRIGEDTYLDRSINYRFGPGSIRTIFDAKIYFRPITSFRVYVRTFHRIYCDLRSLKRAYPQYSQIREYSKTMLDWGYIDSLSLKWRVIFRTYYLIRQSCRFLFKHNLVYSKKSALDMWS